MNMTTSKTLTEKLSDIQQKLDAPKNQWNDHSKYKYRSCEDINEAVKPLLKGLLLKISDELVQIGERYYIKATAEITDGKESISTTAYAREAEDRKGMDHSQITGAASSYARKYALNGLFLIDDTKDPDTQDNTKQGDPKSVKASTKQISLIMSLGKKKCDKEKFLMLLEQHHGKYVKTDTSIGIEITKKDASEFIKTLTEMPEETVEVPF